MVRYFAHNFGFFAGLLIVAFAAGITFRYFLDAPEERTLANFLRSAFHAAGVAACGLSTHFILTASRHSSVGSALRRLPLLGELLFKAVAITAALTIAVVVLQLELYPAFRRDWWLHNLPPIVFVAFAMSLVFGAMLELRCLIGGRVLGSFLFGTYRRPTREQRIVMFLDMGDSTTLAERLGELRVHDLITRFFRYRPVDCRPWRRRACICR
jgi:hypothetical protein